mmetsp:Transcript_57361/g.136340  ORF Transcript_57361/g.136340 Transcript_57361/m.136340 type:complete len:182 (+) Transcript_57361:674-1219(+)
MAAHGVLWRQAGQAEAPGPAAAQLALRTHYQATAAPMEATGTEAAAVTRPQGFRRGLPHLKEEDADATPALSCCVAGMERSPLEVAEGPARSACKEKRPNLHPQAVRRPTQTCCTEPAPVDVLSMDVNLLTAREFGRRSCMAFLCPSPCHCEIEQDRAPCPEEHQHWSFRLVVGAAGSEAG